MKKIRNVVMVAVGLVAVLAFLSDVALAGCPTCKVSKPCATCTLPSAKKAKVEKKKAPSEIADTVLLKLIKSNTKVIILDARAGKWDDGRRIPGAKSLSPKAKKAEVEKVAGKNKKALIVTYCTNRKCPASSMLTEHLEELGYTNILEYPEGIEGWAKAGHPIDNTK